MALDTGPKRGEYDDYHKIDDEFMQEARKKDDEHDSLFKKVFGQIAELRGLINALDRSHRDLKDFVINVFTYTMYPQLKWLYDKVTWILDQINKIYNDTIGRIEDLYNKFFGWYEDLRRDVTDLTNRVARVIGVFDKKIADNIKALRDEVFAFLDVYSRDIRDWVVEKIQEYYLPLRTELYEITGAIKEVIQPLKEFVDAASELIPPTIEKPALLSRDTMYNSGSEYGQDLLDGYFDATTPPLTPEEARPIPQEVMAKWFVEHQRYIILGPLGPWADLHKYLAEEIIEITTGKTVKPRTEVIIPEYEEVE